MTRRAWLAPALAVALTACGATSTFGANAAVASAASSAIDGAAKSANASANPSANASSDMVWNFQALLDGKPIGTHRFSISAQGDERTLVSEANLTVKFFGLTVYRYWHKATEQWHGDCLHALSATTDDDGQLSSVRSAQEGDVFSVMTPAAMSVSGCVMSYAYWNPAMRAQTRLLNAQTGRLDAVSIVRVDSAMKAPTHAKTQGLPSDAMKFRISGQTNPIDVWYSAQGEWIGLDANVRGGHTLSYRLQ